MPFFNRVGFQLPERKGPPLHIAASTHALHLLLSQPSDIKPMLMAVADFDVPQCPAGIADFLQEVTSPKDQAQYW